MIAFVALLGAIVVISIFVSLMILTIGVIGTLIAWIHRLFSRREKPVAPGEDPFANPPDEEESAVIEIEAVEVEVSGKTRTEPDKEKTSI